MAVLTYTIAFCVCMWMSNHTCRLLKIYCVSIRLNIYFEQLPFQSVPTQLSYQHAKRCRRTDRQIDRQIDRQTDGFSALYSRLASFFLASLLHLFSLLAYG